MLVTEYYWMAYGQKVEVKSSNQMTEYYGKADVTIAQTIGISWGISDRLESWPTPQDLQGRIYHVFFFLPEMLRP